VVDAIARDLERGYEHDDMPISTTRRTRNRLGFGLLLRTSSSVTYDQAEHTTSWTRAQLNKETLISLDFSGVAWPVIAAISLAEQPASAKRRAAALRRPWVMRRLATPDWPILSTITIAKSFRCEGFPKRHRENALMGSGPGSKHLGQLRVQRHGEFGAGLALDHTDRTVADVTPCHARHVGHALAGKQQSANTGRATNPIGHRPS